MTAFSLRLARAFAARKVAEEEVAYTADLCESFNAETWITVKRTPKADGEDFDEHYQVFKRLMIGVGTRAKHPSPLRYNKAVKC